MLVLTWVGHMSVQLVDWQYEFSQYANLLSQTTFMATLMHVFYADIRMQISDIILKKHLPVFTQEQVTDAKKIN